MGILNFTNSVKAEALTTGDMFSTGDPMFKWPVVTDAMRQAVLDVLENFNMSGTDITNRFEREFADWMGLEFGLGFSSGTASLQCAMFGVGLGAGDELICPGMTFWASCAQALSLRASVVFADIEPDSLCLDPDDLEKRITPRTKAIMVVHQLGHPADMDRILPIARRHGLKVIEDVSHAQGSLYKGRLCGTFGDVAAMSLMSAKSFAIGEAGMLVTNDRRIYERAVMFGRYEHEKDVADPELLAGKGIPLGGCKYRMHQMSSAVGREILKTFPAQMQEVDRAMNYFMDGMETLPGIRGVRPPKGSGSTMGAWYCPGVHYDKNAYDGLSIGAFTRAVACEGISNCRPGCNFSLYEHPLFYSLDVYGEGRPTSRVPEQTGFPVCDTIRSRIFTVPWFKHFEPATIDRYLAVYRKVAENHRELLPQDEFQNEDYSLRALTPSLSKKFERKKP